MLKQDIGEYEIKVIFWISKFLPKTTSISMTINTNELT